MWQVYEAKVTSAVVCSTPFLPQHFTLPHSGCVSSQETWITFSGNEHTGSHWDHLLHRRISALECLSKLSRDIHLTSPPSLPVSAEDERILRFRFPHFVQWFKFNIGIGFWFWLGFWKFVSFVLLILYCYWGFFPLTDNDLNLNWYGYLNSIRVYFHFPSIFF